jgi:hypothetical protein
MKSRFGLRSILLVLLTAGAGAASSLLAPWQYWARSAVFGGVLGLGVLGLDYRSQRRFEQGLYPEPAAVLVNAFVVGVVAMGLLSLEAFCLPVPPKYYKTDFPALPWLGGFVLFSFTLAYTLALYWVYHLRSRIRFRALWVLLGAAAVGFVLGGLRGILQSGGPHGHRDFHPQEFIVLALLTGVPFCLPWMLAVWLTDPGWSPERWKRLR